MREKHWRVDVFIDEHDNRTRAQARLHNPDETGFVGTGQARLNPTDADVPEIGDELAVSRALSDLAHRLLDATAEDIEAVTRKEAHLKR
ncbi:DUF1876 domain-containing protein [Amycolatopsis sp. K13G38]|uniref:DUF1876 domain-containing protein n=1 Tax=Amycolatopsis acididurans TaxID=2724524 RepID=A0ABX1IWG7_9PSEU|nr:DUF1876 domain-containing protein [Amycolatopsis acididurans]NKQ51808.1 DUF1876 domain-containing protein [Amycolatopsis acididurans]